MYASVNPPPEPQRQPQAPPRPGHPAPEEAPAAAGAGTTIEAGYNRGVIVGHEGYGFVAGGDIRLGALKQINFFRGSSNLFEVAPVPSPPGWSMLTPVAELLDRLARRRVLVLEGDSPAIVHEIGLRLASLSVGVDRSSSVPGGGNRGPVILEWKGSTVEPDALREELQTRDRAALLFFPEIRRDNLERLLVRMGDLLGTRHRAAGLQRSGPGPS